MPEHIQYWFPTLIYNRKIEADNDYLIQKAYQLKEKYPNPNTGWRCETFNTMNTYHPREDRDQRIFSFIDEITNHVYEFGKVFNVKLPKYRLKWTGFWFNIASPGQYQEFHQHPVSHFSLVYYLKVNPNCGNFAIRSLEAYSDMLPLPLDDPDGITDINCKVVQFTPEPSQLLIFRSHLPHMVDVNKSNEDRISISMNYIYEGII